MVIKELIKDTLDLHLKLEQAIYNCKDCIEDEEIFNKNSSTVNYYKLPEEAIESGDFQYYITVYDNQGTSYETAVLELNSDGKILGYVKDLDKNWIIEVSDLSSLDYLTVLKILNDYYGN